MTVNSDKYRKVNRGQRRGKSKISRERGSKGSGRGLRNNREEGRGKMVVEQKKSGTKRRRV